MCGNVNRHNIRISDTENPHGTIAHVRDSPKVNVFCAVSSCKVYGPFFFAEPTYRYELPGHAAIVANATIKGRWRGLHFPTR